MPLVTRKVEKPGESAVQVIRFHVVADREYSQILRCTYKNHRDIELGHTGWATELRTPSFKSTRAGEIRHEIHSERISGRVLRHPYSHSILTSRTLNSQQHWKRE